MSQKYLEEFVIDVDYSNDGAILVHKPCKTWEPITDVNLKVVIILAIMHRCPPKEEGNKNG